MELRWNRAGFGSPEEATEFGLESAEHMPWLRRRREYRSLPKPVLEDNHGPHHVDHQLLDSITRPSPGADASDLIREDLLDSNLIQGTFSRRLRKEGITGTTSEQRLSKMTTKLRVGASRLAKANAGLCVEDRK